MRIAQHKLKLHPPSFAPVLLRQQLQPPHERLPQARHEGQHIIVTATHTTTTKAVGGSSNLQHTPGPVHVHKSVCMKGRQ